MVHQQQLMSVALAQLELMLHGLPEQLKECPISIHKPEIPSELRVTLTNINIGDTLRYRGNKCKVTDATIYSVYLTDEKGKSYVVEHEEIIAKFPKIGTRQLSVKPKLFKRDSLYMFGYKLDGFNRASYVGRNFNITLVEDLKKGGIYLSSWYVSSNALSNATDIEYRITPENKLIIL